MKNKIEDLRNHCFSALERLNDETLKGDKLKEEIERAKAISDVAQTIVNSAKVEVDFVKVTEGRGTGFISIDPPSNLKALGNEKTKVA
jgi:hypothetical protein